MHFLGKKRLGDSSRSLSTPGPSEVGIKELMGDPDVHLWRRSANGTLVSLEFVALRNND